jgi:hypothetical protein
MDYFFDFELSDFRGIPLYVPIRASATDLDDARFVKGSVGQALGARGYTVKQSAGPWPLVSPEQEGFVAERRAAYETTERPQRTIPCSVVAPPNSKRKIPGPLIATVLDPQRTVEELLAITIEL